MAMISDLPDELILKILSSLFLRDLVPTSVLSRRWRSLWKLITNLKIGDHECSWRCVNWVPSSLALSNPQVLKSLDFKRIPGDADRMIESWVTPAVYCGLRELRIELLYSPFELPISLYACETLETLTLCKLALVDVPPCVCLSSLKTLRLLSVKFSSDESVQKLLGICPVLEDLAVRRSIYTSVVIFTINVPTLTSLSIHNVHTGVHGFVINVPSLRYLNIRALEFSSLTRILKDAPRLRVLKLNSIHCLHYNHPMDRWNQPSSVPECLPYHLEIFEWRQYKGTKQDKQVARYILANAGHLKMATFSSNSTEKHQMFKKLEYVPMCSKGCQLLFD